MRVMIILELIIVVVVAVALVYLIARWLLGIRLLCCMSILGAIIFKLATCFQTLARRTSRRLLPARAHRGAARLCWTRGRLDNLDEPFLVALFLVVVVVVALRLELGGRLGSGGGGGVAQRPLGRTSGGAGNLSTRCGSARGARGRPNAWLRLVRAHCGRDQSVALWALQPLERSRALAGPSRGQLLLQPLEIAQHLGRQLTALFALVVLPLSGGGFSQFAHLNSCWLLLHYSAKRR